MMPNRSGSLQSYEKLASSDPEGAANGLRQLLRSDPLNAEAYRLLATIIEASEANSSGAGEIRSASVTAAGSKVIQAAQALGQGDLPSAERILRARLMEKPTDVDALLLFARLAIQIGYQEPAEELLRLALEFSPGARPIRLELAALLHRLNRPDEALPLVDELLAAGGTHLDAMNLRAAILARAGRLEDSSAAYEKSLRLAPHQARVWMHYAGLLRTTGQNERTVAALRKAIELEPTLGESWWNLSDLKTLKMTRDDIDRMEAALRSGNASEQDQYHLHFALGKALEDAGEAKASFAHYVRGNQVRRSFLSYDADALTAYVDEAFSKLTRDFFEKRRSGGFDAPDAIFIIGMPRSGSTLVEQILATHPQIEGTMELPELLQIGERLGAGGTDYIRAVQELSPDAREALGREYIEKTRRYRETDRPFFVDKMPNNWMHVPLIRLILPNARIIDARRHPLACCLSIFQQHFIGGQPFAYDLTELGRYYADYVRFMSHIDTVLPGAIYRVSHEKLVDEPEREIRCLLNYLGLPYDEACLRFYENPRVVRSASSEQVRRPLNRDRVERWRAFEPWLDPLKAALGPALEDDAAGLANR